MAYIGNQPAETPVKEILETDIKIGEDDQTKIDFETANTINFYANNAKEVVLTENSLTPGTSDGTALGTTSLMWSDLFLASGSVINLNNGDVTLTHSANTLTVAGGTLATAALTASTGTFSGILKTDDTTEATSTTDGSLQTDGGLSVAKDAVMGDDVLLLSDSAVLKFGADSDTTLTHTDGTGLTLNSTNKLTFGDAASFIQQSSDGVLRIDGEATVDINASTAVTISNDLKLDSDSAVLGFGADNDATITHADDAGLTFNSATTFSSSINLALDAHLDSTPGDEKVSGITATFQAGEALERGECVYFKASDSKMHKAVATASATSRCVALAAEDLSADANGKFLLYGFIEDNGTFPAYTVGGTIFTPEAETSSQNVPEQTAPDSDGDFVQVLGFAVTANKLFFNPSNDVIEHA
tara:strand:+ start:2960 stop:4204 length:1245 start_codon:yes stop_codon:yes gene_type:complete